MVLGSQRAWIQARPPQAEGTAQAKIQRHSGDDREATVGRVWGKDPKREGLSYQGDTSFCQQWGPLGLLGREAMPRASLSDDLGH